MTSAQGSVPQGPHTPGTTPPLHRGSLTRMQATSYHPLQGSRSNTEPQPSLSGSVKTQKAAIYCWVTHLQV